MGEHFIYIWSATKFRWWPQWAQAHAHGTNATSGHSERNQCALTKRALTTSAYSSDLIRLSPFHLNIDKMIKGRMFKGKYDPFVRCMAGTPWQRRWGLCNGLASSGSPFWPACHGLGDLGKLLRVKGGYGIMFDYTSTSWQYCIFILAALWS